MNLHYRLLFFLFILLSPFSQAQTIQGFSESFDDNHADWATGDEEDHGSRVENGKYVITHKDEKGSYLFYKEVFMEPYKDFNIEVKMTQVDGIDNNGYGIVFGMANTKNSYNFVISSNGLYSLYGFTNDEYRSYKEWTDASSIINPIGKPNILGIKRKGEYLHFSINGKIILVQKNTNFYGMNLGFVLNWKMTVEVDYLKVDQPYTINTVKNNGKYKKENLGTAVNSKYEEVMPLISADGKTLYIDRKDHPQNVNGADENDDIWYSEFTDGKWANVKNIGKPLNNDGHNFVFSISPDNNTMLVGNTYLPNGDVGSFGVSITNRTQDGWEIPTKLNIENYYNNAGNVSFSLSADGKVLLMAVGRDDSYGEHDVYVSFLKSDGSWSEPKNLGPIVNTLGDEATPYLASDNVTLYYSTSGKPGYGSNDIFVTKRLDNSWTKWSEPLNLGPEVNSKGWDAYYTVEASGKYAYFASTGAGSMGEDDVFRIQLIDEVKPEPVVMIVGKVVDKGNKKPLGVEIVYYDLKTKEEVGRARSNPKDGSYKIVLPYGKEYGFHAEKKGYYAESDNIDLTQIKEYQEIKRDLALAPIVVGKNIALNNVFFVQSKAILQPTSYGELDRLVGILKENPAIKIEVAGHTDNVGDPAKNLKLSEERVEAIKDYLTKNGIAASRISGKGYGGTQPIASNDKEETRKLNRRVEFKIISK